MRETAYLSNINPQSRAHPSRHVHANRLIPGHFSIGGFADPGQVDDVARAVSAPLQEEPEPGIADHFGRLPVILSSGSRGENGVPPTGWTPILPHGDDCCVDIKRTFPYQLFNGYDEFEIRACF